MGDPSAPTTAFRSFFHCRALLMVLKMLENAKKIYVLRKKDAKISKFLRGLTAEVFKCGDRSAEFRSRVVLDSFFSGWLDSDSGDNPGGSTLTQLTFLFLTDLTPTLLKFQFWYHDSTPTQLILSELSQIWLTAHHILPDLSKKCWLEERGSNVAVVFPL